MATMFKGGVALKIDAKSGFISVVRGSDYASEETTALLADAISHATEVKTFIQAFIPETKPDKAVVVTDKGFKVTGFKASTIAELSKTKKPVVLCHFAGRTPIPFLAFFDKDDKPSASATKPKAKSATLARRS